MIVTAYEQIRSGAEQSCNFFPSYLFSLRSSFRSAPSDNDWYSPCPVPTERSGTRNGEIIESWGKKLHCSSGVPIVVITVPFRSVGTGGGLYQSLSLGAERNSKEIEREGGREIKWERYFYLLTIPFRSVFL